MSYLRDNCQLLSLSGKILDNSNEFSCGNADLDDFFRCTRQTLWGGCARF